MSRWWWRLKYDLVNWNEPDLWHCELFSQPSIQYSTTVNCKKKFDQLWELNAVVRIRSKLTTLSIDTVITQIYRVSKKMEIFFLGSLRGDKIFQPWYTLVYTMYTILVMGIISSTGLATVQTGSYVIPFYKLTFNFKGGFLIYHFLI